MELRNPIKRSEEILVESLRRRRMEFGKFGVVLEIEDSVLACLVALGILLVDLFDGHFFRAMEWLMFFSRAPSASMVFQWFCQR